ncbi:MAG TPA: hypothetical protein VFB30_07590 [Spirochaetia bacterium]|nr:hypothetical protein [Spirochaetia bacterium]
MILPLEFLKKIGVALQEGLHVRLIDHAAANSSRMKSRFSVSGRASEVESRSLRELSVHEETFLVTR